MEGKEAHVFELPGRLRARFYEDLPGGRSFLWQLFWLDLTTFSKAFGNKGGNLGNLATIANG